MSTPQARSEGQRHLDMSQDSLFDDDEVDDPASPSPAKQQRKRRKQYAVPARNSSSGSAGSAQRAGRGGGTGWHGPLGGNAGKTAHARRKGKRTSPSAAANAGGSSFSGKSVAVISR